MRGPRQGAAAPRGAITAAVMVGAAAAFAALAAREARVDGPTFDEPTYVIAASLMGDGVDPGNHEHPPLAKLLFLQGQRLLASPRPAGGDAALQWAARDGLSSSRAVTVAAGALACGLIAWSASPYGLAAAVVAGATAAFLPAFLAHGHLATLDMLLALFFAVASVATESFVRRPTVARGVLVAIAVCAALTTKWTALVLLGALPLAAFVAATGPWRARLRAALLVSLACAAGAAMSAGVYQVTVGLDSLVRGLEFQAEHARRGHTVVFLGRSRSNGTPAFFVVALALTAPLALWPLAAAGARRVASRACLWLPAVVLLVALSFSRVQLGVRYVLPVYVPLLVAAGAGFSALRAAGRGRIAVALVGAFIASSLAFASHLPYRNEFRYLSRWRGLEWLPESDGDWGQGAPSLVADLERSGVEKVCIAWYGPPVWRAEPELVRRSSRPGECTAGAVGTFLLFTEDRFEALRRREPLNPGSTVLIFDLKAAPGLEVAWR